MDQRAERAEIVVDVAAIRANARLLRATAGVPLIAVVKADGYGHGMVEAARAAREGGAEWVAAATQDEALALRRAGDDGPLLCWLAVPGEDWTEAVAAGIDVTAYSVAQLDEIAAAVGAVPARVQIKVDTGLWRGGVAPADWAAVFARARAGERDGTWRITGIWSHFACSDEPDHPANDRQQAAFDEALDLAAEAGLRPEVRHLSNSAATLTRPAARYDAVRCGIALYGQDPAPGNTPEVGLRPAMTVRTHLALVKHLEAGASVSYGHTWTADRPTTVGLVPLGYGDGVPRHASNLATVGVDGKQRPIRGRVCMDQFVVDLDGDRPPPGTEVVLFGEPGPGSPTAQDWAAAIDTINYEIVTRIGGTRVPRRWIDTDARDRAGGPARGADGPGEVELRGVAESIDTDARDRAGGPARGADGPGEVELRGVAESIDTDARDRAGGPARGADGPGEVELRGVAESIDTDARDRAGGPARDADGPGEVELRGVAESIDTESIDSDSEET